MVSINDKYRADLESALNLPQLPADYEPQIVEIFDRVGLLISSSPCGYIENSRPANYQAEYLAFYFDGELVFFLEKERIHLSRLKDVAFAFDFYKSSEA